MQQRHIVIVADIAVHHTIRHVVSLAVGSRRSMGIMCGVWIHVDMT
jgi:hypothetical protein